MNNGVARKLFILILISLIIIPISSVGCRGGEGGAAPAAPAAFPPPPSPSELSATLVPNTQLDLYAYIRQDSPTIMPAGVVGVSHDVGVESLAIWGVPAEAEFAFGMGITLTDTSDASGLYDRMAVGDGGWKLLSENTVYLVQGGGGAAESLKTVISNNDFKHYDDKDGLEAVATLPIGETTELAGVIIASPSEAVMSLIGGTEGSEMINLLLELADIEVIAAGMYSSEQIDLAKIVGAMGGGENFFQSDLGMVILIKSGRPGFLVEPIVTKMLSEMGYTETSISDLTVYKGSWDIGGGATPALIRVEGSHIFIAISEQESYLETLIAGVKK